MKVEIKGSEFEASDKLEGFTFNKVESRNVDVWGVYPARSEILVQFLSGKVFIYSDIDKDTMSIFADPKESIGVLVNRLLVNKFPSVSISPVKLIKEIIRNSATLSEDVFDYKRQLIAVKGDPIKVISEDRTVCIVEDVKGKRFSALKTIVNRLENN